MLTGHDLLIAAAAVFVALFVIGLALCVGFENRRR